MGFEPLRPIRGITKYQKWVCQPGNEDHFRDYVHKRLMHKVKKTLDRLLNRPDGRVFLSTPYLPVFINTPVDENRKIAADIMKIVAAFPPITDRDIYGQLPPTE
jgi:hypothetical protein